MSDREEPPRSAHVALGRVAERARGWLREASRHVLTNGMHVADEGDRWFIAAVRGLDHGAQRVQQGADTVTGAIFTQLGRLRPRWTQRRTPKERLEDLLRGEARRFHFDVTQEPFRAFAEKIAVLLELVFTGVIRLDDIAFEPATEDSTAKTATEPAREPAEEPLTEAGQEMPEPQQREEREDREAVHAQKAPAP